MTDLKAPNVANLESILNRIWSGELEHNQRFIACDTACCLAGWDAVINNPFGLTQSDLAEYEDSPDGHPNIESVWDWSANYNNLTEPEAQLLYSSYTTKGIQKLAIQALKEGRRLIAAPFRLDTIEDYNAEFIEVYVYYRYSSDYSKVSRILADLCAFLGPVQTEPLDKPSCYLIKPLN